MKIFLIELFARVLVSIIRDSLDYILVEMSKEKNRFHKEKQK